MLPSNKIDELCDPAKFKEYFTSNQRQNFYAALNGIQGDDDLRSNLIVELDLLNNEGMYLLNNIPVSSKKAYVFFKALSENLYRLKNDTNFTDNQTKYLGSMLWGLLGNYSMVSGYSKQDFFEQIMSEL